MKNKYYFMVLAVLLISCGKENTTPIDERYCTPEETGIPIPPYRGPGWGFEYVYSDNYIYSSPYCNPLDKNEFVYKQFDRNRIENGIYIYNILTKQKTLVLEIDVNKKKNYPVADIRWSKKNWLIFADFYQNIYKIKPNGDSLTQLTFEGGNFKPEWNYDGTLFCMEHHSPINNKSYTIIRDENGLVKDSLQNEFGQDLFIGQPDWQHSQYILGGDNNGFATILYDYAAKKIIKIQSGDLIINSPKWINENEFIYTGGDGIYTYNIKNNKIKQLRKTINSNFYRYLNLSENKQMICERTNQVLIDSIREIILSKTTICILNPCDTVVTDFDLR